jgi:hypothetical protein
MYTFVPTPEEQLTPTFLQKAEVSLPETRQLEAAASSPSSAPSTRWSASSWPGSSTSPRASPTSTRPGADFVDLHFEPKGFRTNLNLRQNLRKKTTDINLLLRLWTKLLGFASTKRPYKHQKALQAPKGLTGTKRHYKGIFVDLYSALVYSRQN